MKNKLLLICFVFTMIRPVFAQDRFRVGIVGGLVASEVAGSNPEGLSINKAGFSGGAIMNAKLTDKNSFQFEILYVQKGSQTKRDTLNDSLFYRLSLNYVEVPLIFRHNMNITVNKKKTKRLAFEIGPSIGFLTKIKSNYQGYAGYIDPEQFRKLELALNIGFSISITENFMFNVRYSNSIIPVIKNSQEINSFFRYTFYKGDNMLFNFSLRYLFGKGKSLEITE